MKNENVDVSRFELLMDAGRGAQKAGDILLRTFAHTGRSVFIEPMIPSEISPPVRTPFSLSGALIRVANFDLKNTGNDTDVILAEHEILLDRRISDKEYNKDCRVLLDVGLKDKHEESYTEVIKRVEDQGIKIFPIEISEDAKKALKTLNDRGHNMYYLGILSAVYCVPGEAVIKEIKAIFGEKLSTEVIDKNIDVFLYGHEYAKENVPFSINIEPKELSKGERILIDGNTAIALGIIDAGIKLYSGYPITPASSIMHTLAKIYPSYGGMVHQAEDEISAIGTAIGAYFGGVPAVTGTSGPGLSLKQEFIGFASAAEAPLIVIDVQRCGPSTGMPTKTEQSDLPAVIWGSHGDNTKIVIGVGNMYDCFFAPKMARYLTEKLKVPVFIMSDFQMANCLQVIDKPLLSQMENGEDLDDFIFEHFWMDRLPDDIEMVSDHQDVPGVKDGERRITGLNIDREGTVNYFAKENQRSHEVRNEKIHHVQRALHMPDLFGTVDEGDILVMGWGTTRGAIAEAVHSCQDQGLSVGGFCFRIVYPLPLTLQSVLSRFKRVVTVEAAYGDTLKKPPLAMLVRSKTLINVECMISPATGRPITPRQIEDKIKDILNGK